MQTRGFVLNQASWRKNKHRFLFLCRLPDARQDLVFGFDLVGGRIFSKEDFAAVCCWF